MSSRLASSAQSSSKLPKSHAGPSSPIVLNQVEPRVCDLFFEVLRPMETGRGEVSGIHFRVFVSSFVQILQDDSGEFRIEDTSLFHAVEERGEPGYGRTEEDSSRFQHAKGFLKRRDPIRPVMIRPA